MSIKFLAKLGANTFEADGDFLFDEGFNQTFRAWINAQQDGGDEGQQIEDATANLKASTDKLQIAISANTPT